MRAVGIRVLKNKLSEYVRLVAAGETVLVTDRDRVVAEMIPPREGRSTVAQDATLAELVRTGVVEPPLLPASGPPPRSPVKPIEEVLVDHARDREDR